MNGDFLSPGLSRSRKLHQIIQFWTGRLPAINRYQLTFCTGLLFLGLGLRARWYELPQEGLAIFNAATLSMPLGRAISLSLLLFASSFALWKGIDRVPRGPVWGTLTLCLLFPYGVMTWFPQQTFVAQSFWHQLSRANLHVETSFAEIQAQWKQTVSLTQYQPIETLLGFQIEDYRFFQLSSWEEIFLGGFGFNNSFLAFIDKGWSYTVLGVSIILAALYLSQKKHRLGTFWWDLSQGLPLFGTLVFFILIQIFGGHLLSQQLEQTYARGQYAQVVQQSQRLVRWYPPLQGDTEFLLRWAEAEVRVGEAHAGRLAFARGVTHYRQGNYEQAIQLLRTALNSEDTPLLTREYLVAALMNRGIEYFNQPTLPFTPHGNNYPNLSNSPLNPLGPNSPRQLNNRKSGGAATYFEQALEIIPGHVEALYDLMVIKAVDGQFEESAAVGRQIIVGQQAFQTPNIALIGQAYLHQAWADYHRGDKEQAWLNYQRSIDTRLWPEIGASEG